MPYIDLLSQLTKVKGTLQTVTCRLGRKRLGEISGADNIEIQIIRVVETMTNIMYFVALAPCISRYAENE